MTDAIDYRDTLFLPQTSFPMRAGLPQKEPEIGARWEKMNLYKRLREQAKGRPLFVLHDGPPYANGNIHIGHALNKILKDVITRSRQMMGFDSNYVPGWDCHGLPIEWKIEEEYRAKGKNKDEVPVNEFRKECRAFAEKWIDVQRAEFKRLGIEGDWDHPYTTMAYQSEAQIARELMKFAQKGTLYRGSKPVMWSVVERTALAEAEIEYQDYQSDMVWVKFPVQGQDYRIIIWTTTPWTLPGNRAIAFSPRIEYGLYEVTANERDFGPAIGEKYVLAKALAEAIASASKLTLEWREDISAEVLSQSLCDHPLKAMGYDFTVPVIAGDHVTDDAGTGFVHTAPSHGREDFDVWTLGTTQSYLRQCGIDTAIPFPVDDAGYYTKDAPGFDGARVINDKGEKGDANERVIKALIEADALVARARLKHQYPHSWRSKKPVIFRNTPQWFITMGDGEKGGLREVALKAIDETAFYPPAGKNRLRGMIEQRPDWVISRQRAWGVPITVFRNDATGEVIPGPQFAKSAELEARIYEAFAAEGADAWFAEGAKQRFLSGLVDDLDDWRKVSDILDVWFDSGSTHAFVLEQRPDLKWPADVYLEGSDQHRGWFHSSLLESCGTRGRAPYGAVVTHGFTMDEQGRKMSKSLGNQTFPQDVIKESGADILRLWVMSTDYADDQRIGKEILKSNVEAYRKLRNTLRYILGALDGFSDDERVALEDMPELERYMLHKLHELRALVMKAYSEYDFRKAVGALLNFMNSDLSAFYLDIRKDALYCDPLSATRRKAARTVIDQLFRCMTTWLAPMLCFTMEEVWLSRFPEDDTSVHLQLFAETPDAWNNPALAAKWENIREVRRVITGALEIERQEKKLIGSSLEAAPEVYVTNAELRSSLDGIDLAEISITSAAILHGLEGPADAFRLPDVEGVSVSVPLAQGKKCQRSWKISPDVGTDAQFPDITPRDAEAVREWQKLQSA